MEIAGRVAVVTGAAIGSGRAIALALAEAAAQVVAADVDEAGGRETAARAGGRFVRTDVGAVRVNCVVPDWLATERVTAEQLATDPPPIALSDLADAVLRLIRDDSLAGRALVMPRGEPPCFL